MTKALVARNGDLKAAEPGWLPKMSGTDRGVLLVLLAYQNMGKGAAFPGSMRIARLIGHQRRSHVDASLSHLLSLGLIRQKRRGGGSLASEYVVTIPGCATPTPNRGRPPTPKRGTEPSPKPGSPPSPNRGHQQDRINETKKESISKNGNGAAAVALLMGVRGMEEPDAARLAGAHPEATIAAAVAEANAGGTRIKNPAGYVVHMLENPTHLANSRRRRGERRIAHLPEHMQEDATGATCRVAERDARERRDVELMKQLSADQLAHWKAFVLKASPDYMVKAWENRDPCECAPLASEIARRVRAAGDMPAGIPAAEPADADWLDDMRHLLRRGS